MPLVSITCITLHMCCLVSDDGVNESVTDDVNMRPVSWVGPGADVRAAREWSKDEYAVYCKSFSPSGEVVRVVAVHRDDPSGLYYTPHPSNI